MSEPTVQTGDRIARVRCRHCGDTLHRLRNGWGHDKDNFATCLYVASRTGKAVPAEPFDEAATYDC